MELTKETLPFALITLGSRIPLRRRIQSIYREKATVISMIDYFMCCIYTIYCVCVGVWVCVSAQMGYGTTGTVNSGWRTGVTNDSTRCYAGRGMSIISNERNHRTMRVVVAVADRETRKEVNVGSQFASISLYPVPIA